MLSMNHFFGGKPAVHAQAPGRVNLLGEHTDYNDGFMLPVATPPNAVVYGTGRIPIRFMARTGFWLNIAGIVIVTLVLWLRSLTG